MLHGICMYEPTLLTLHSEVDSLCRRPSFIYSHTLIPAGLIRAHRGHMKRKVGQDLHTRVQAGIAASSDPCEVVVDRADNVASEEGTGAG